MATNHPSVFLLGTQMTRAGAQHSLLKLGRGLHTRGWRVSAAFLYDKDGLRDEWQRHYGIPIYDLRAWQKNGGAANLLRLGRGFLVLVDLLRRERNDLIMTYTQHSNLIGIPLAWLAGVPLRIASNRGCIDGMPPWLSRLHGWMVNSRLTSCLVANSAHVREEAVDQEKVVPSKITIVPNGVPLPEQTDNPAVRAQVCAEFAIPSNAQLLVTVGRLTRQKGHVYLIQALPQILQAYPDAHLLLIGEGELRQPLSDLARELGVLHAVHFLGLRADVGRLLSAADIFVFPTLWEGMPNALLEAMASGIPAAASSIPETREILKDGENGLLFTVADARAAAAAVLRLLGDADLRNRIGVAGREFVAQHFSEGRMISAYAALFQKHYDELHRTRV